MGRKLGHQGEIITIARMHYEDRLPQHEIASKLGVSTSTISRALKKAMELGFVEIRIVPHAYRDERLEQALIDRFGLQSAVVAEARPSQDETLQILGDALAHFLERIVSPGMTIGVSDGQTLAAVANGLRNARTCAVRVLPLIGGVGAAQLPTHPSEVSRMFATYLGGEAWNLPVPAVADDVESAQILSRSSSTKEIFSMMSRLDIAIVGLGTVEDTAPILQHRVITPQQMRAVIGKGATGSICARFFDETGHSIKSRLDSLTMSATLEQLTRCPRRILAANGLNKVAPMRSAITGKIVNIVGTDSTTAKALLET